MKLKDKVIVITGSSRGIGKAVASACLKHGAKVVISSRSQPAVDQTVSELGPNTVGITADVTKTSDLKRLIEYSLNSFGRIDVWINNAGIASGYREITSLSDQDVLEVVQTNLFGTLNACRLIIPYFIKQGHGIIINLSGRGGKGETSAYMTPYASTKAGVTTLTKSLAKEYKQYPISINCVLPGMVDTDMYRTAKVSQRTRSEMETVNQVLKTFGTPIDVVADLFVELAAQRPGRYTGKCYNLFKGWRKLKALLMMTSALFVKNRRQR